MNRGQRVLTAGRPLGLHPGGTSRTRGAALVPGASVLDMVEIEEEENLSELSVTQLKKRMKERDIDASGCTEVMSSTCQHTGTLPRCSNAPPPNSLSRRRT